MKKKQLPSRAFPQTVIACVWDFDKTLIAGYMQEPLFAKYHIDGDCFWDEVNHLQDWYKVQNIRINPESIYLNHLLTYVKSGKLKGLNNRTLKELGKELVFYPGLPQFFTELCEELEKDSEYREAGITLEHYVVSTGFAAMIRGSAIAPLIKGVWGCEFIESPAPVNFVQNKQEPPTEGSEISQVAYTMDNTAKTRALYEINKGSNVHPEIDVNARVARENRRIPFENMIYIADGPSDIPAFATLKDGGGRTYAIYPAGNDAAFAQVDRLQREGRIQMYGVADYTKGSGTWTWIRHHVRQVADSIVERQDRQRKESISEPPKHLHD